MSVRVDVKRTGPQLLLDSYTFNYSFFIKERSININNKIEKLAFSHGGINEADGFTEPTTLEVEGIIYGDTSLLCEQNFKALNSAFLEGGKLSINDDIVSRYIDVSPAKISSEWIRYPFVKSVNILFNIEFPFFLDTAETTQPAVLTGNTTFTIDATGSVANILPVINVIAHSVDIPNFKLQNTTDGGIFIEYVNPYFITGDKVEINNSLGTIKRNGIDEIAFFYDGSFLRLKPGVNTFVWTGQAATLEFIFRKTYV